MKIAVFLSVLLSGSSLINAGCSMNEVSYALPADSTNPNSVAFSPNGLYCATANTGSNNVTIYQVGEGGNLSGGTSYALPSGSTNPYSVAFSPNGSYLAVARNPSSNNAADIVIFQVASDGVLSNGTSYQLPSGAYGAQSLAFSPNGLYLAVANNTSGTITIFQVETGGVLNNGQSYPLDVAGNGPWSVAFSPNGLYLATAYGTSTVTAWNGVVMFQVSSTGELSGRTSYTLPSNSLFPQSIVFSPNGLYLATANFYSNDVTVFQVQPNGVLSKGISYSLPSYNDQNPASVAFSLNGAYLATVNEFSNGITLFHVGLGGILSGGASYALPSGSSQPGSVAFSPDGSYLVTANFNSNNVTVFNTTLECAPSGGFSCDTPCIIGVSVGGGAVVTLCAGLIGGFLLKKIYIKSCSG